MKSCILPAYNCLLSARRSDFYLDNLRFSGFSMDIYLHDRIFKSENTLNQSDAGLIKNTSPV